MGQHHMPLLENKAIETPATQDLAKGMQIDTFPQSGRLNLTQDKVKNGLGQLVLTLVKLLHELLEKQAIRRMESGSLTEHEIERVGTTLMKQAQEIEELRKLFNLEEKDLNLDLGPLGKLM